MNMLQYAYEVHRAQTGGPHRSPTPALMEHAVAQPRASSGYVARQEDFLVFYLVV